MNRWIKEHSQGLGIAIVGIVLFLSANFLFNIDSPIKFIALPVFLIIAYYYEKQQSLKRKVEQTTSILEKSEKKFKEITEHMYEGLLTRTHRKTGLNPL